MRHDRKCGCFKIVWAGLALCLSLQHLPGGAVAFAGEGQSQDTFYGIGSTSKVVTAAAVLQLFEEGKVDLDEPLTTYIPEFVMADIRYRQITPRMLLDHSSGIQGSTLNNSMLLGDSDTDNHDRLLDRLSTQRLKAAPGEFSVYCNDGFTLAEILVERVSGMSFSDYLEQEMAAPLGLDYFKTPQSLGAAVKLAPIYDSGTGRELPADMANVIGSGGMYATAEDLCRLSQMFMEDQGEAGRQLTKDSAVLMEKSDYGDWFNPEGRDTSLSYGLGWDCVGAYPFNRYGIRALVKGGDTSYYHSSLTVLPEENISCAVLTSGGSTTLCQLAVQEILLSYLEEIERIDKTEEVNGTGSLQAPAEEPADLDGWYAGNQMMKATLDKTGRLTLASSGTGHDRTQTYLRQADGSFASEGGAYLNPWGAMVKGGGGKVGNSVLRFECDTDGKILMTAEVRETYPGLGSLATYLPVGEKIGENQGGAAFLESWQARSGREYYLVSEKYTSALYLTRFMVKPMVPTEPEGYLTFQDSASQPARLSGALTADFFQKIPGQVGRDLLDYRVEERGGNEYFISGDNRYVSGENLKVLKKRDGSVTLGENGETVWYDLGQEDYGFLSIRVPEQGAFYVYDTSGKTMECVASSWTTQEGMGFLLPGQGKIAFCGLPGEVFQLQFSR